MKKLTDSLHLTERTKLFLSVGLAAALLLAAMLVPLAFRTEETSAPETETAAGRAELFQRYLAGSTEGLTVETLASPDETTAAACETRMHTIAARCIDDQEATPDGPYSSEYTLLSDGATTVRLCRMWLELRGDWQNWLDVFFDADTGQLYHLYLSRERLSHAERYPVTEESRPTARYTAGTLANELGGVLSTLRETGDNRVLAVVTTRQETLYFDISSVAYDNLIDLTIDCL